MEGAAPHRNPVLRTQAAAALTRAFHDDPLYSAVLPDARKREQALLWLHDRVIRFCSRYGIVQAAPSTEGVACWLEPGRTDITMGRIIRSGLVLMPFRLGLRSYLRLDSYMRYSTARRKEIAPDRFFYLWVLGVDPSAQGRGVAGGMLRPILERADSESVSCFVETENERNVAFYEHHGFQVAAAGRPPGLNLNSWAMLREPGTR